MKLMPLRVARAALGISQYNTARLAGISANRYWRIENGQATPSVDEQAAIARVLALPLDAVFGHGTNDPACDASEAVAS